MAKKYKCRMTFTGEDGVRHDIRANSQKELFEKLHDVKERIEQNLDEEGANMRLENWAELCIDTYKTSMKDVTLQKYKNRVNHCIVEHLGNKRLKDITSMDCQMVMNLQTGMSQTQINDVFQAFHFLFWNAKADHYIYEDPTECLRRPKAKRKNPLRALTPEERRFVLDVGKTDRRYFYFLLMLLCGCRPSEAAECKTDDVVESGGEILLHIRGTKTHGATRYVPMPDELYCLIQDLPEGEYIAQTREGNKLDLHARQRVWKSFKRQLNIRMGCRLYNNELMPPYPLAEDLVPYDFRHEYCTELARQGVDVREAQKLMGHSNITLTINIYTNLDPTITAVKVARQLKNKSKKSH